MRNRYSLQGSSYESARKIVVKYLVPTKFRLSLNSTKLKGII